MLRRPFVLALVLASGCLDLGEPTYSTARGRSQGIEVVGQVASEEGVHNLTATATNRGMSTFHVYSSCNPNFRHRIMHEGMAVWPDMPAVCYEKHVREFFPNEAVTFAYTWNELRLGGDYQEFPAERGPYTWEVSFLYGANHGGDHRKIVVPIPFIVQ